MKPGESATDACVRELREESGLDGRVVREVLPLDNRGPREHCFRAAAQRMTLRVAEPEASRTSVTDRYRPMWLPLAKLADVDLRPDEARQAVMPR